jgi:hypothetical protein
MAKSTNPKGAGRKPLPEEKLRTSLHIRKSLMKDIKYISFMDEISQTDIIDQSISEYVNKWVQKNGPIPKK